MEGADLFTCGSYIFNHYRDCQDMNHYLASDQINDLLCLPSEKHDGNIIPVLACHDRVLRIIQVRISLLQMVLSHTYLLTSHSC